MIYIPKKINAGFQNRPDTYTGKLAYVIYYDGNGKLRKEASWNGWRDQNIQNEEYDNVPTSGFVLNKKVGGTNYGWNPRQTYTRIYDPRGYEFEITIPNLLYILENTNSIRGKGLEGEFVYGWDGKDLVLIPVNAPEYQQYKEESNRRDRAEYISAKDLTPGRIYVTLFGEKYTYLGRFDKWEHKYFYNTNDSYFRRMLPEDYETYIKAPKYLFGIHDAMIKDINKGKHYYFMCWNVSEKNRWMKKPNPWITKSISKKFVSIEDNVDPKYPDYIENLQHWKEYSPIDYNHVDTIELPLKNFVSVMNRLIISTAWYPEANFLNGEQTDVINIRWIKSEHKFKYKNWFYNPEEIARIYYDLRPVYKIFYLMNGEEYFRKYYHEESDNMG